MMTCVRLNDNLPQAEHFPQQGNRQPEKETSSDQRETSSDHRETSSNQRETSSDQRKTSSDQRETSSDHRETSSDQRERPLETRERTLATDISDCQNVTDQFSAKSMPQSITQNASHRNACTITDNQMASEGKGYRNQGVATVGQCQWSMKLARPRGSLRGIAWRTSSSSWSGLCSWISIQQGVSLIVGRG